VLADLQYIQTGAGMALEHCLGLDDPSRFIAAKVGLSGCCVACDR
jgi:hypothetical protein